MTTKADFTEGEWKSLVRMPAVAGVAVILADESRPRGRRKEIAALERAAATIAGDYADNALVQAALPDVQAYVKSAEVQEYAREKQTDRALQIAVDMAKQATAILDARCEFLEADGFKRFVLQTGLAVAQAAADAEFLGIGGQTLSLGERKTLLKLVDVMHVDFDY